MFWWVIPAAYTLVRSESEFASIAVSAAALVPLTPLFWPLALERFSRARSSRCRSFSGRSREFAGGRRAHGSGNLGDARLPPGICGHGRDLRDHSSTEARAALRDLALAAHARCGRSVVAAFWVSRLSEIRGRPQRPRSYLEQFLEPKAALFGVLQTSLEALTAAWAPGPSWPASPPGSRSWRFPGSGARAAAGGLCGAFDLGLAHVRYVMPMAALVLAAGLIGYARLANWFLRSPSWRMVWVFLALRDPVQRRCGAPR